MHARFLCVFSTKLEMELRKGDTWSAGDVNKLRAALRSWMERFRLQGGSSSGLRGQRVIPEAPLPSLPPSFIPCWSLLSAFTAKARAKKSEATSLSSSLHPVRRQAKWNTGPAMLQRPGKIKEAWSG